MKKILIFASCILTVVSLHAATSLSNFYVTQTGNNLNAGSTTGDVATYTAVNGNWDGTSVYTPVDGSTPANTVSAGMFASVYLDATTNAVYVGRITAVAAGVNGAITLSTTAVAGTAPTSGATGRSIKVGGAWAGPAGANNFPFNFITSALTDADGDMYCVNLAGGTNYNITATLTHSLAGPGMFRGYTNTVGDTGMAVIDGGATGTGYGLATLSGANIIFDGIHFQNNGNSGNVDGLVISGTETVVRRCIVSNVRRSGFSAGAATTLIACTAYGCNQANVAGQAGFNASAFVAHFNCLSYSNTTANANGFANTVGSLYVGCISTGNTLDGLLSSTTTTGNTIISCDFYNNGGGGIDQTGASATWLIARNSNFLKNGVYGINSSGSSVRNGYIQNCGVGSGTQANGTGDFAAMPGVIVLNTVTYASNVTPWAGPTSGDFRITLAAAKAAGIGSYTQDQSQFTGSIAYPDIGSNQANDSLSGGGNFFFTR